MSVVVGICFTLRGIFLVADVGFNSIIYLFIGYFFVSEVFMFLIPLTPLSRLPPTCFRVHKNRQRSPLKQPKKHPRQKFSRASRVKSSENTKTDEKVPSIPKTSLPRKSSPQNWVKCEPSASHSPSPARSSLSNLGLMYGQTCWSTSVVNRPPVSNILL